MNKGYITNKDLTEIQQENSLILSYCYGGIVSYDPGEILGPRTLTDFEAVIIIEGNPVYEASNIRYKLKPGSIILARPETDETYFWDAQHRTRHAYLHFNLDKTPTDWPSTEVWPRALINPPNILRHLLHCLTDRALNRDTWPTQKPGPRQNRLMESFLDQYLHIDEISNNPNHNLSEPISKAVKFMRERLDALPFIPYDLEELSRYACTSSKNLCRVFKNELGISPIKACRLMQLQLAIPLLARSNLSIKEISERCGFIDQLYFSRYFSSIFDKAPSIIREELHIGLPPPHNPLPPILTPRLFW